MIASVHARDCGVPRLYWAEWLHQPCHLGVPNASERGTKSEVAHTWAGWLHHPCHLGVLQRFRVGGSCGRPVLRLPLILLHGTQNFFAPIVIPPAQVLPLVLGLLPIGGDLDKCQEVYERLVGLHSAGNPVILQWPHLKQLASVLLDTPLMLTEGTKEKLRAIVHG